MAYKLVHYINQFFAGIGGEEKADITPEVREGIVGPGAAFKAALGNQAEIVATFICGDNYCANHLDEVAAQGRQLVDYTAQPYESFIAVTLLYLLINVVVMTLMRVVENKTRVPGYLGGK